MEAAAYRSGGKIYCDWNGVTYDYTKKGGVVHTEILLPSQAPMEYQDRATLWNSVEAADVENLPSYAVVLDMKPGAYSKEREINAGYQILAKAEVGPVEYALAENPHTHFFATWERTPGNDTGGERNYYWGHYHEDRKTAIVDFCARVSEKWVELSVDQKPSIREQLTAKPPAREVSAPKPRGKEVSL